MPWNTGFYVNLSTLSITRCSVGAHSELDKGILCVLQDCPDLYSLELSLDESEEPDTLLSAAFAPSQRIVLKLLHTIKLNLPARYAHHILSAIVVNSLSTVQLELGVVQQRDVELVATIPEPGILPAQILSSLQALHVRENWKYGRACFTGWNLHTGICEPPSFKLEWSSHPTSLVYYLRRVVRGIEGYHPMPLLSRVVLEGITPPETDGDYQPFAFRPV